MKSIPDQLRSNDLTTILDEIRKDYSRVSRVGVLDSLIIADQDAKVLAVNTFCDTKRNYWDIAAIGSALYGVCKQGRDFFKAEEMEKCMMVYKNVQFFVQLIGTVELTTNKKRDLILIVIGDKQINIGLVLLQLNKFVPQIRAKVETDEKTKKTMQMSETEFMKHLGDVRKELFANASK